MLSPGIIVDGRFEILRFIGEGGMGTVYAARHKKMQRDIAIKLLKTDLLNDEEKLTRFRNEARILSNLDHENLVAVYALGIAETGQPYIAMDFIKGQTLSEVIKQEGSVAQEQAIDICLQICAGLEFVHAHNIIHRDIKPSNIILQRTADGGTIVKLVDFGVAKLVDEVNVQKLTKTGMAIGSAMYLSPEQFEGRPADATADIYALGCTLFEMLVGKPPFAAESFFEAALLHKTAPVPSVNDENPAANISESLQTIINCMLQKEHQRRYQSAQELATDLNRQRAGLSLLHAKATKSKHEAAAAKTRFSLKRVAVASAALVLSLLVCSGALSLLQNVSKDPQADATRALDDALHAEALTSSDRISAGKYLKMCDRAIDLTAKSGSPLMHARALETRALMGVRAKEEQTPDKTLCLSKLDEEMRCFKQAVQITDDALHHKPDRADVSGLRWVRFNSQMQYLQTGVCHNSFAQTDEWDRLIAYVKDRGDELTHHEREDLNGTTWKLLCNSLKHQSGFVDAARIRGRVLNLLGTSAVDRREEFETLPQLHEKIEDAKILNDARKAYESG